MPGQAAVATQNHFADLYDAGLAPESELDTQLETELEAVHQQTSLERPRGNDGRFLPQQRQGHPHPAHVVRMARDLGIDEESIASLSTAELRVDVQNALAYRNVGSQAAAIELAKQQSGMPERGAPVNREVEQPDPLSQFDDQLVDPNLLGALKWLVKEVGELKGMRGQIDQLVNHVSQEASRSAADIFDRQFLSLPPTFSDVLGRGRRNQYTKEDYRYVARSNVVAVARKMAGDGASVEDVAALIPQAAARMWPDKAEASVQQPRQARQPKAPRQVVRQRELNDQNAAQAQYAQAQYMAQERQRQAMLSGRQQVPFDSVSPQQWQQGGISVPTYRTPAQETRGPQRAMETVQSVLAQLEQLDPVEPNTLDEFI